MNVPVKDAVETEDLLLLPDAAQIFFVKTDGTCSTFSERSMLRIFTLKGQEAADMLMFIQVAGWSYPLIAGKTPVLEAANGAYMFPEAVQEEAGTAVGIVLVDNVSEEMRMQFHNLLDSLVQLKKEEQLPQEQQLGSVGKALVGSAEMASKGMGYAAEMACKYIESRSEKERMRTKAAEEDVKVSPYLKYSVKGAGYATKATVKATGFVADKVGQLTRHTADYLAKKIDSPAQSQENTTSSKAKSTLIDAARGGLLAYGTVYTGLERNAKTLGSCIKSNTVEVVQHKYGGEASELSGEAMQATGDAVMTYMNVAGIGVKGIVKNTAKYTVQGVLEKQSVGSSSSGSQRATSVVSVVQRTPVGSAVQGTPATSVVVQGAPGDSKVQGNQSVTYV